MKIMNAIYRTVGVVLSLSLATLANAQTTKNDSTLTRQISVEKDFTPTLQDASKINTLPAVREPEANNGRTPFDTKLIPLSLDKYPIGDVGPGEINTSIDYSKKKGYLGFSAGNNLNLDGKLGYRFLNTAVDQLDVFARHNSTNNGTIEYNDPNFVYAKVKAKYMDNLFKAAYTHNFDATALTLGASFFNTAYNYYGNSFVPISSATPFLYNTDASQNVNVFNINLGLGSLKVNDFNFSTSLGFDHFGQKYGPTLDDGGFSGNILNFDADVNTAFATDKYVGLKVGVMNQTFGNVQFTNNKAPFYGLTNLEASPYVRFEGENWKASLGAKVNYMMDNANDFAVSPDVTASWQFGETSSLYAGVTGGINNNTYLDILKENRYVNPSSRIAYSHTLYDASLGIKSGAIDGFEFDIFTGYKQINDDHFYTVGHTTSWGNVSDVVYGDVSEGRVGASINTKLIPCTDVTATVTGYFYSVKMKDDTTPNPNTPWNRPNLTVNLCAVVNPIAKLNLSLNYLYEGGRKYAEIGSTSGTMKNINELDLRGEYQLTDWLSFNVQANNVLNQSYELWKGYTQQGLNVLGGVIFKF